MNNKNCLVRPVNRIVNVANRIRFTNKNYWTGGLTSMTCERVDKTTLDFLNQYATANSKYARKLGLGCVLSIMICGRSRLHEIIR